MFSWVRQSHLAEWCGLPRPKTDAPVISISTDSRTVKAGEVFLALKGESFDGHDYVTQAVAKGASAVIAERPFDVSVPVLVVPSALHAFATIASALRRHFRGPVIAVTGSAGKSSTKEMIARLLGPATVASPASFNNLLGVSKTLCLVDDSTRKLVLEMGMNALGEIAEMCAHFHPEAGLITNIGDAHLGKLGGQHGIYRAKRELFESLAREPNCRGVALNVDDPLVREAFATTFSWPATTVRYSAGGAPADVRVLGQRIDPDTGWLSLTLSIGARELRHDFPIYGKHHTQNIAAAVAAAKLLGVEDEDLAARLSLLKAADHRGEMHILSEGRVLIDESYNSNPTALASSLESLGALSADRRRVLVIGEMRELGEFSEAKHREAGERLVSLHQRAGIPFILLGVGREAEPLVSAVRMLLPKVPCDWVADRKEVAFWVRSRWMRRDILFFKGSHGVRLDLVVSELLKGEAETRPLP